MQTTTSTLPTVTDRLLLKGFTPVAEIGPSQLWQFDRSQWPHLIVSVRNVKGGRRITDEYGTSRTYTHGTDVPTAVVVG